MLTYSLEQVTTAALQLHSEVDLKAARLTVTIKDTTVSGI